MQLAVAQNVIGVVMASSPGPSPAANAAPCNAAEDVVVDPHARGHHMVVEIPRFDGEPQPVLAAGNPVKLSRMPDEPSGHVPRLGEDTTAVLGELLWLDAGAVAELRDAGAIG